MENRQEMPKELDIDQLNEVTGGAGGSESGKVVTCQWCGQEFYTKGRRPQAVLEMQRHMRKCPKNPLKQEE